jgi:hypothetical protein
MTKKHIFVLIAIAGAILTTSCAEIANNPAGFLADVNRATIIADGTKPCPQCTGGGLLKEYSTGNIITCPYCKGSGRR